MPAPVAAAGATASFGRALGESAASTGTTGLINGFLGQLFGGMNALPPVEVSAKTDGASAKVCSRTDAEAV